MMKLGCVRASSARCACPRAFNGLRHGKMAVRGNAGQGLGIQIARAGGQTSIDVTLRAEAPDKEVIAWCSLLPRELCGAAAVLVHCDIGPVRLFPCNHRASSAYRGPKRNSGTNSSAATAVARRRPSSVNPRAPANAASGRS